MAAINISIRDKKASDDIDTYLDFLFLDMIRLQKKTANQHRTKRSGAMKK